MRRRGEEADLNGLLVALHGEPDEERRLHRHQQLRAQMVHRHLGQVQVQVEVQVQVLVQGFMVQGHTSSCSRQS